MDTAGETEDFIMPIRNYLIRSLEKSKARLNNSENSDLYPLELNSRLRSLLISHFNTENQRHIIHPEEIEIKDTRSQHEQSTGSTLKVKLDKRHPNTIDVPFGLMQFPILSVENLEKLENEGLSYEHWKLIKYIETITVKEEDVKKIELLNGAFVISPGTYKYCIAYVLNSLEYYEFSKLNKQEEETSEAELILKLLCEFYVYEYVEIVVILLLCFFEKYKKKDVKTYEEWYHSRKVIASLFECLHLHVIFKENLHDEGAVELCNINANLIAKFFGEKLEECLINLFDVNLLSVNTTEECQRLKVILIKLDRKQESIKTFEKRARLKQAFYLETGRFQKENNAVYQFNGRHLIHFTSDLWMPESIFQSYDEYYTGYIENTVESFIQEIQRKTPNAEIDYEDIQMRAENKSRASLFVFLADRLKISPILPLLFQNKFTELIPNQIEFDQEHIINKVMLEVIEEQGRELEDMEEEEIDYEIDILEGKMAFRVMYAQKEKLPEFKNIAYCKRKPIVPFNILNGLSELADQFKRKFVVNDEELDISDILFPPEDRNYKYLTPELFIILNEEYISHEGELLYLPIFFADINKENREKLPLFYEQICVIFQKYANSLIKIETLFLYYARLKEIFPDLIGTDFLVRIETILKKRWQAEKSFIEFFVQDKANSAAYAKIRSHVYDYKHVFFLAFIKTLLMLTGRMRGLFSHENEVQQDRCIHVFLAALDNFLNLKDTLLNQEKIHYFPTLKINELMTLFEAINRIIKISAEDIPRYKVDKLFGGHWGDALSMQANPRFEQYEKCLLKKVRNLAKGGQGETVLVKNQYSPILQVAKYYKGMSLQLKDEIIALLSLQGNPHVVSLYGFISEKNNVVGILMEYCEEGTLDDLIKGDTVYGQEGILLWTTQAASGLIFLHRNNIIHRDVKPQNMLLDYRKRLKLIDLGISKLVVEKDKTNNSVATRYLGTPGFAAPEAFDEDSDPFNVLLDVFSLGRSVWNMVTRETPKNNKMVEEAIQKYQRHIVMSPELTNFYFGMMAQDKKERPSMAEVYKFCDDLYQECLNSDIVTSKKIKLEN